MLECQADGLHYDFPALILSYLKKFDGKNLVNFESNYLLRAFSKRALSEYALSNFQITVIRLSSCATI